MPLKKKLQDILWTLDKSYPSLTIHLLFQNRKRISWNATTLRQLLITKTDPQEAITKDLLNFQKYTESRKYEFKIQTIDEYGTNTDC